MSLRTRGKGKVSALLSYSRYATGPFVVGRGAGVVGTQGLSRGEDGGRTYFFPPRLSFPLPHAPVSLRHLWSTVDGHRRDGLRFSCSGRDQEWVEPRPVER